MVQEARTRPGGRIVWNRDATANDSDKTFPVPVGKAWDLFSIEWSLVATATAGNRVVMVTISDTVGPIHTTGQATAIVASNSGNGIIATGVTPTNAGAPRWRLDDVGLSTTNSLHDTLPPKCLLEAGYTIRVYDINAVAVAADDMIVVLHYIEYDA